ncbi:nitrogenase component 1 [Nostoc sp. TCL26-01]|uniref:nitrogenase component 1 n=1 Tax=Nostoc sp. TCL26-01 TaxID=2576904 RepID=UPI0015C062D8|nr:nitrogenase component 1 [Nostoc sp. TCL26-01]QLE58881.1 nitrogenase iron-molybdenum cofactor biosynthesis protein NifE [Nostoc sp. TCL26-01]
MKPSQEQINEPLDEFTTENEDKFGTQVPSPLDAHEDCAFDGAMFTLGKITDVAHLIHGPSGCINNWENRISFSSDSMLHKVRFTTDMEESDIIFGGAKKLHKAILELSRRYKPAAIFVYSTCVSALIGDDIHGACASAREQTGIPVIPVDSPGFVGRKNLGIRVASDTLLENVIGTAEPEFTTPLDINLISEYNVTSLVWDVLPLLDKLGIRVLAKITGDVKYQEICYAHRAKLNVVIGSKGLLKMAKKMEKLYDIPYVEASLDSWEDIHQCLRNIVARLGNSDLQITTEKLIAEATSILDTKLAAYRVTMQGKKIIIYADNLHDLSLISAAKTLGMDVIIIANKKMKVAEKIKIKNLLNRDVIVLQQESIEEVMQIIEHDQAQMLIASVAHRLQFAARLTKIPFLDINQVFNHAHMGYTGIFTVAQQLYATLYSPVWQQVSQAAPWE